MLVAEAVDFSFQLVGFLFFYHFYVTLGDLFHFLEARVAKTVPSESNFGEAGVFVEGFNQSRFHIFGEEIFSQLDGADVFVVLQSINQINQPSIIQSATGKIKLLQLHRGIWIS